MNKTAFHKILAIVLICAVCLSCGVYAFASESEIPGHLSEIDRERGNPLPILKG